MPNADGTLTKSEQLNSLGADYYAQGNMEAARIHFLAALYAEPDQPQVLQNLGATLRNFGYMEAAESLARRSVKASDNNVYCRSNLGVAKLANKKFAEAKSILAQVVKELPDAPPSWHNYGLASYMVGNLKEAKACFSKSVELDPSNMLVQSDLSLTLLGLGEIQRGLEAYECRWKGVLWKNKVWSLNLPQWSGEDLKGKSILVHHEQGFGDSLMLSRFLNNLNEKYKCEISCAVPKELLRLFEKNFPFVKFLDQEEINLDKSYFFDFHCPMLSLVRHLELTKLNDLRSSPYLRAFPIENLKFPKKKWNVGICWASGNHGPQLRERRRYVPLTKFLPISEFPEVSLLSLQKGEGANDISLNGMEGIVFDLQRKIDDFQSTAEIIAHLDVIIAVDTSVVHLAGAMGKPVIMLSPYTRCWRWWDQHTGRPWYENFDIVYQESDGNWEPAMNGAARLLKKKYIGY